jgi:hypothetical protein
LKGVLRLTLNEIDALSVDWSEPEFHIAPNDDDWITSVSRDITTAYILIFWDKANHPAGWEGISSRFKTEEEIQRYLEYVRFIVGHFKDRIHYYELWNESNARIPWQYIEPADYINLAKRTIPVIREIDPEAKIMVGGTSGLEDPEAREYLFKILQSDVMPTVDVVSWHPLFGDSPKYDETREYYYSYPSLVQQIKDVASANGFGGEYRADELTWRTPLNPLASEPWTYSETTAAKYYARGIVLHLGMDVAVGVMIDPRLIVIRSTGRNLCTLMDGARPISLRVEIQSEATRIMSYGFILPNGDQLFALWNNGLAVDDDPGVKAALTFPGLSAPKVTGIDVLNGFEQELITKTENGSLVIRNLMVKDYPIILRLFR